MHNEKLAFRVGLTVICCMAIFAGLLIRVGNLQNYLKKRRIVEVVFADSKGLPVGAPVLYQGLKIGTVSEVSLIPATAKVGPNSANNTSTQTSWVQATLDLEASDLYPISYDDQILIQVPLAMGDPDLRITPAPTGAAYDGSGAPIIGATGGDLVSAMNNAMRQIEVVLGDVLGQQQRQQLREAITRAHSLLGEAQKSVEALNTAIPATTDKLATTLDTASTAIKNLDKGTQETLASAKKVTDSVQASVNRLDGVIAKSGENLNKTLSKADQVLASGDATIKGIHGNVESVSTNANAALNEIKTLASDTKAPLQGTLREATAAAKQTRETVVAAADAVKTLQTMLSENRETLRQALAKIEVSATNLKSTTTDVKRHPWKLLRKPSKRETVSTDLATASDQAATAADQLQNAVTRLETIIRSEKNLLDTQLQAIEDVSDALKDSLKEVDDLQEKIEEAD